MQRKAKHLWIFPFMQALVCLLTATLFSTPAKAAEQKWTNNEAMLVLFEILQLVESKSVAQTPLDANVETCIDQVLTAVDSNCAYMPPQAFDDFKQSQNASYAGVGMDLQQTKEGAIILRPYKNSPAAMAGIELGDELIAVGTQSISGETVYSASQKIRGSTGSKVMIFFRSKRTGNVMSQVITRRQFQAQTVEISKWNNRNLIQIFEFTPSTTMELKYAVSKFSPQQPLLIDLRGNSGGDLYRAIECAALFLKKGDFIVRVANKDSHEDHIAKTNGYFQGRKIILLQDEQTASAAEVFIDALLQNDIASTWGTNSYGKGTTQHIFPISNGGAIILTNGELQRQDESSWNLKGIHPSGTLAELLVNVP